MNIIISYLFLCIFKLKWAQLLCPHIKNFHQKKKKNNTFEFKQFQWIARSLCSYTGSGASHDS